MKSSWKLFDLIGPNKDDHYPCLSNRNHYWRFNAFKKGFETAGLYRGLTLSIKGLGLKESLEVWRLQGVETAGGPSNTVKKNDSETSIKNTHTHIHTHTQHSPFSTPPCYGHWSCFHRKHNSELIPVKNLLLPLNFHGWPCHHDHVDILEIFQSCRGKKDISVVQLIILWRRMRSLPVEPNLRLFVWIFLWFPLLFALSAEALATTRTRMFVWAFPERLINVIFHTKFVFIL